jgi:hypothetical protein
MNALPHDVDQRLGAASIADCVRELVLFEVIRADQRKQLERLFALAVRKVREEPLEAQKLIAADA